MNLLKKGIYVLLLTLPFACSSDDDTTTDVKEPLITLAVDAISITVGDAFTIPTATAQDDVDSSVTLTSSGTVDTSTVGTYTITYTATDAAGNTATKTLTVTVEESSNTGGEDDSNKDYSGCTDPNAINYNPFATLNDGSCKYSFVGDWTAYYYTINDVDILSSFNYFDILFFADSTCLIDAEGADGTQILTSGRASFNDINNTMTLTPDNGASEVWNLTYFNGEVIYMNLTDASGYHVTRWVKY